MNASRIRAMRTLGMMVSIVSSGMPIFVARRRTYVGVVIMKRMNICVIEMKRML